MNQDTLQWLLNSNEPWTRYRVRRDLLDQPENDPKVRVDRQAMLSEPAIKNLIAQTAGWPGNSLRRHNDASHLLHTFSVLADFGIRVNDPGMEVGIQAILSHHSPQGAFQSLINIPKAFGGSDEDQWTWILCDAPTLLYTLAQMGLVEDARVRQAADFLVSLVEENGWRCVAATELGKFRGPGRKTDPCPIANLLALKAISAFPELRDSPATHQGVEMLLEHWENRRKKKYYLFAMGSDFCKLKYPFIWYDILHVLEVLSHFPFTITDPRFQEMLAILTSQADDGGCYTAQSMYQAWKGWSFANKKNSSPWLTFLVYRIQRRVSIAKSSWATRGEPNPKI